MGSTPATELGLHYPTQHFECEGTQSRLRLNTMSIPVIGECCSLFTDFSLVRGVKYVTNCFPTAGSEADKSSIEPIESYLAASERNRVCYPQTLPWPLPIKWTGFTKVLATQELVSRVHEILEQHNIPGTAQVMSCLQWRFDEPKRSVLRVYLTAEGTTESWLPVAEKIHQLLPMEHQPDTLVELVNLNRVNYRHIISKCVSESDRDFFRARQGPILDGLLRDLGTALLSVGLFMSTEGSGTPEAPCLFAFVTPGCLYDWSKAATRVATLLAHRFAVQFRPGRVQALMQDLERGSPHGLLPLGQFRPDIHTGARISASEDVDGGGTLGIFVDLVVSPSSEHDVGLAAGIHKCFLTCDHVVRPPRPISASPNPLPFNSPANPDVVYPSRRKLKETIAALKEFIELEKRDLQELKLRQEPEGHDTRPLKISHCKAMIKTYGERLATCDNLSKRDPVGKVLYSSGIQVTGASQCLNIHPATCNQHDHHLKDFALVKLAIPGHHYNKAPVIRGEEYQLQEMEGIAAPVRGLRVFKYGSETGITTGLVGDEVFLRRPEDVTGFFTAWPIFGDGNTAFSKRGDSASAITSESRALVGHLHSGIEDAGGFNITFMTAAESMFADIMAQISGIQLRISRYIPSVLESSKKYLSDCLLAVRSRLPGWEQEDVLY